MTTTNEIGAKAITDGDAEGDAPGDVAKPKPTRQPSLSLQSKQRSESFRRGSTAALSPGLKSPTLAPLNSGDEVQEIYHKQSSRIEELEKENKALKETQEEHASKLRKTEEEVERLREGSGDVAELKTKASLADERAKEIEKLVRTCRVEGRDGVLANSHTYRLPI